MWYEKEPEGFSPRLEVSGCFVEHEGTILLIKRADWILEPGKWAIPAGSREGNETPIETAVRETKEETGIDLANSSPQFIKTIYERYTDYDFTFHMTRAILTTAQMVSLNSESTDCAWVTPFQALQMDLIEDLDACIRMVYPDEG
jgi:8-oxo-dGTP pyrophosphatase MutT (NUDIX family)